MKDNPPFHVPHKLLFAMAIAAATLSHLALAADVAIDVGHTAKRPGCISAQGISEYEWNKRLASGVADAVNHAGMAARLIYGDDGENSLYKRTLAAARDKLFISIHHDSVQPRFMPVRDDRFAGFSLWVSRKNIDYERSVQCAAGIAGELIKAGFAPSHYHADAVPGENRPVIDWTHGIFANDDLAVLKTATTAAVLVEAGVIVNPREEERLARPDVARKEADAIAAGLRRCVAQLD